MAPAHHPQSSLPLIVLLTLAFAACDSRCTSSKPAATLPPAVTAEAPPDKPKSRRITMPATLTPDNTRSPFEVVPDSDSILSAFVEKGDACLWVRFDPVTKKRTDIVETKGCPENIAWSSDGRLALLRTKSQVFFVDVGKRALHAIAEDERLGVPWTLGIDSKGQAWAFTFAEEEPKTDAKGKYYEWDGRRIPSVDGGGLAHAWKRTPQFTWKHHQLKESWGGSCSSPEEHVFDEISKDLGYDMDDLRGRSISLFTKEMKVSPNDPALPALKAAFTSEGDEDSDDSFEWSYLPNALFHGYVRTDIANLGGIVSVAFVEHGMVTVLEPKNSQHVWYQGKYILLGPEYSLYDVSTMKTLTEEMPDPVVFWPTRTTRDDVGQMVGIADAVYLKQASAWNAQARKDGGE